MEQLKAISLINNTIGDQEQFSENVLSNLIAQANSFPGVAYWKSNYGVYLWHNDYTKDHQIIFNLTAKECNLVGKTDYDLFPQNIADNQRKDDLEAMISKRGLTKQEVFYDQDNKKHLMLVYKRPMINRDNNITGIIVNIINITSLNKSYNNYINMERIDNAYDSILQPLKEIMLLLNLMETTVDYNNNMALLSEINNFTNSIFNQISKNKNQVRLYV